MTPFRPAPAWFPGNDKTRTNPVSDCHSRYGALALVQKIEDAWQAFGIENNVVCRVEPTPGLKGFWQVRSNLVNGLPPTGDASAIGDKAA